MERYERNILLRGVGEAGQAALNGARVLQVGAGGLGSPVAYYLAAAGVGTLGIMDGDRVDESNLNRQILHTSERVGEEKVISAARTIEALNPSITVQPIPERLTPENALSIMADYDVVVDCVDSFSGKFLINDAAVLLGKTYIHCGVVGWGGQLFTHRPGGPCLRCLMPFIPGGGPQSTDEGILGAVAGSLGSIQASEVVKAITGAGTLMEDRILFVDFFDMTFSEMKFARNSACPVCGEHPTITSLIVENYEIPI